jgi:hypothetical protein
MKAERLLTKLLAEAEARRRQQYIAEGEEYARRNSQPESQSDQCRRKLRDLRTKTNAIECELDLRQRVELQSQKHLKATMALREANLTAAEKQARAEEARRGQILFANVIPENHPDWREQENSNLAFYGKQIAPSQKRK